MSGNNKGGHHAGPQAATADVISWYCTSHYRSGDVTHDCFYSRAATVMLMRQRQMGLHHVCCGQTADVWLGVMPQAKTGLQGSTAVRY